MAAMRKYYAWIGPSNGYAVINWRTSSTPGYYDWVGLYANENQKTNDYVAYQWVSRGSSYETNTIITDKLNVRYFTWDKGISALSTPVLSIDELNAKRESAVTPKSLLTYASGRYVELMRSHDLDLAREVNAEGEKGLKPGCWVTCSSNGYVELNWTGAKYQGNSDWVALYQNVHKSNTDYISGAWQWATSKSPYETSVAFSPGIHARYIKEGGTYIALRRSKPIAKGYFDLENMYFPSGRSSREALRVRAPLERDDAGTVLEIVNGPFPISKLLVSEDAEDLDALKKIWEIMTDQLKKAVNREPSVFSPGIYPFGENLLYKNLSYEEVKVIGWRLHPKDYYDVIMVYYDTYKMAIRIADDGKRNAKRHAFWQISMMQKFGESFAEEIANAHEKGRPGTAEDNRVDDLNNKAARKYARDNPDIDPATAADQMWSTGCLYGYSDIKVAPEHTKDEL